MTDTPPDAPPAADAPSASTRSGMVAVVGAANAGKSSLINRILGEKVSIVSHVAQTTRNLVRGIHTEARGQIVFLDTPGVHKAESELGRRMNRVARDAIEGVDVVMLMMDASHPPVLEDDGWMRRLAVQPEVRPLFVLSKSDLPAKTGAYHDLWAGIRAEKQSAVEPLWLSVSAHSGEGVEALLEAIFARLPLGPPLFPEDVLSDFPKRWLIADLLREKLIRDLTGEVPHRLAVLVDDVVETDDAMQVTGRILVERTSQIGIVLGHKGHRLKKVRQLTEAELEEIYERRVKLDFRVKAERKWDQNFWILRQLGYS
jgi:GTP-binding protein Era